MCEKYASHQSNSGTCKTRFGHIYTEEGQTINVFDDQILVTLHIYVSRYSSHMSNFWTRETGFDHAYCDRGRNHDEKSK